MSNETHVTLKPMPELTGEEKWAIQVRSAEIANAMALEPSEREPEFVDEERESEGMRQQQEDLGHVLDRLAAERSDAQWLNYADRDLTDLEVDEEDREIGG